MEKSRTNIIFDLDGTLVDASDRLYKLFQDIIEESTFSKEQYWELKRNKINHCMILKQYFQNRDFECFNEKWMKLIEEPKYLALNSLYEDTIEVLSELSKRYRIVLLTARQSKMNLLRELERMEIIGYLELIYVTENKQTKRELIQGAIENGELSISDDDLFVSDMGQDIQFGNDMGYKTIAVTHGFMNANCLKAYRPNYMVHNLIEILNIVYSS